MKMKHLLLAVIGLTLAGCSGVKKPEAAVERENWLLSLNDSIKLYQQQTEEVTANLSELKNRIGEVIVDFDYVSNPREVEGYYIFKGWKDRYPLTTTGLVARITEDERLELLATLSGATFNEIGVTAGGETRSSGVVPHDQALNYRTPEFNKVCFSGAKADSVAMLIAESPSSEIIYLEGGKRKAVKLPADQQAMLAATWRLYALQKEAHGYEKELPRLAGKIAACRRMLDESAREETEAEE